MIIFKLTIHNELLKLHKKIVISPHQWKNNSNGLINVSQHVIYDQKLSCVLQIHGCEIWLCKILFPSKEILDYPYIPKAPNIIIISNCPKTLEHLSCTLQS